MAGFSASRPGAPSSAGDLSASPSAARHGAGDLLVAGGTLVDSSGSYAADLLIAEGVIRSIAVPGSLAGATPNVLDARGRFVLPGLIDAHVHFREPGLDYKEDFLSGSTAAVMGGITTVLDMPNTVPPTSTAELLRDKQERAEGRVYCNIGFFGLLAQDNLAELEPMADAGAVGFKCFLGQSTGNLPPPDDGVLLTAMAEARRLGLRCAFHAENDAILRQRATQLRASGRTDPLAHIEARPVVAEVEAIQRVALFARETGAAVHILHVSSRDGLNVIEAARARGVDITSELTPHHALFTSEDMQRLGALLRINPPVREPGHAEALLDALRGGRLTYVATDHSPHTLEEKQHENIWDAVSGSPGVETSLRLMLTYGGLSLPDVARLMSEAPARTWGLYPHKGALRVGSDADLTIVDPDIEGTIQSSTLHSKHKFTPFEGMRTRGAAVATIVRGTIIMQDGQLCAAPQGQVLQAGQLSRPAGRPASEATR